MYAPREQYYYWYILYTWTEGDVSREQYVLDKDLDEFYLWLAFKNTESAKEKFVYDQQLKKKS